MRQYMFQIPFAGTMTVWTDAESEAEARQAIMRGDWNDSEETSFESRPEESMILLRVDELTEDGEIEE